MVISGLGVMSYAAYLGILFQVRFFRTLHWPEMLRTNWVKFLIRLLIVIGLVVPFGVIFLVIPSTANLALMIVFKTFVPL